jgi:uncharacterized protein (TIGR03435 family)
MRNALLSAAFAMFTCTFALTQNTQDLTFEVASVRPSAPVPPTGGVFFGPARGGPGTLDPLRITSTYATLRNLIMTAYDVENYQVSGPDWLATERYDINANVPAGATPAQVKVMWQNLLTERFGVALHHESKEFRVEELVVGRNGHKLNESAEDRISALQAGRPVFKNGELASPGLVTSIVTGPHGPSAHTVAKAQPISKLTTMLTNQMHRPVLDTTGLTGLYDFTLDFTPDLAGVPLPPSAAPTQPGRGPVFATAGDDSADPTPDLAGAIQRQLGLRLVGNKTRLDVIVIDKAERKPTDN